MSDLEQQLAGVLTDAAEGAPGATGLADAARRRHRVRRQRRLAIGGAAVALVVGAGAVVAGGLGGNDRASDPVDRPGPKGWQTVEVDGGAALVSIPPDWRAYSCGAAGDSEPVYAPSEVDACTESIGAVFLPAGAHGSSDVGELISGDRGWLGYVMTGDWEVRVFLEDRALVRQILSTARVADDPVVDGGTWVGFDHGGMTFEVPAWWGVGEDGGHGDYSVCYTPSDFDGRESFRTGDSYVLTDEPGPGDVVRVTAPTQAVAELVLATVRMGKEARPTTDCGPVDFTTGLLPGASTPGAGAPVEGGETATPGDDPTGDEPTGNATTGNATTGDAPDEDFPALGEPGWETTAAEYEGIAAEIPTYWSKNFCNEAPQWTPYEDCTRPGEGLRLYGAGYPVDLGREPRELWRQDIEGRLFWTGYVLRGDVAVFITHTDRRTVEVLLEQVH
ncbi:MAG TPA: hypothetical protein VM575_07940 [Nocardioides sp.]|nr:hypothetical protein [Nocardioides sp.]